MPRNNPWDDIYLEHGHVFTGVHEHIPSISARLRRHGAARILDLGSGAGRHLVYFARMGFSAHGIDDSPEGVRLTHQRLAGEHLTADVRVGSMHDPLPFPDDWFDAVIAVQVIHHARVAEIRRLVGEIHRVLKSPGLVFVTVPALRNQASTFQEIEPGTFVPLDGPEKGLPHHYFSGDELRALFGRFDVESVERDRLDHFGLLASKPKPRR